MKMIAHLYSYGPGYIFGALLGLFLLERIFPLRPSSRPLAHRLLINAALSLITFSVAGLVVRPLALGTLRWGTDHSFGILRMWELPFWAASLLAFLLLDLTFYYWHRLNHRAPFFWRFHNVHHFDPDLDTSTGFRFHFGEVAFSTIFRIGQVLVIGPSFSAFVIYEFVFQVGTYFHHSNLRLPLRLEKTLNYLLVTPRMHEVHHSQVQGETDSNYSVVLSWWDRIHGTMGSPLGDGKTKIGVPGYSQPSDNTLSGALLSPFRAQRNFWRKPGE